MDRRPMASMSRSAGTVVIRPDCMPGAVVARFGRTVMVTAAAGAVVARFGRTVMVAAGAGAVVARFGRTAV